MFARAPFTCIYCARHSSTVPLKYFCGSFIGMCRDYLHACRGIFVASGRCARNSRVSFEMFEMFNCSHTELLGRFIGTGNSVQINRLFIFTIVIYTWFVAV